MNKLFSVFTYGALGIYAFLLIVIALGVMIMYPIRTLVALAVMCGIVAAQLEGNPVHTAWCNVRNAFQRMTAPKAVADA